MADNPLLRLRSAQDLVPLWTTDYWRRPEGAERLWRPLSLVTLALEQTVHGGGADAFHRSNALLHGLIAAGLYVLFCQLLGSRRAAALGAAVFALHPVHAEASAGIVGRSELLALGLSLLAWLAHLRGRRLGADSRRLAAWLHHGAAAACFFLAATSKEIALAAPFVLIVLELAARSAPRGRWRAAAPYVVYLLAIGAYLACRALVLEDLVARPGGRTLGDMPFMGRLLVAGWIYLDALASLLLPHASAAHYPFGGVWLDPLLQQLGAPSPGFPPQVRVPSWDRPATAAPLLLHAGLLTVGLRGLRSRTRWARACGAGVWGFYLALGPVSNLLIPIGVVRADRLLYLPSALFALSAGALGWRLLRSRGRDVWCLTVAAVAIPYAVLLSHNVHSWTHELPLWERTVRAYPDEPRGLVGLAMGLLARGQPAQAEPLLQRAVELCPAGKLAVRARANWGHALAALGRHQQAEQVFVAARQLDSGDEAANVGLANLYMTLADGSADAGAQQRYNRMAVSVAREGTRVGGHSYRLWLTLGSALARLPEREVESQLAYDRAVELSANPWQALVNRAVIDLRLNDAEAAERDYARVCELLGAVPPRARTTTIWLVLIDSLRARRELAKLRAAPHAALQDALAALAPELERAPLSPTNRDALLRHLAEAQR